MFKNDTCSKCGKEFNTTSDDYTSICNRCELKCRTCGFDYGFIVDYTEDGRQFTFCENCGTRVAWGDMSK